MTKVMSLPRKATQSDAFADSASFRDPSGHVYRIDGRILRTVTEPAVRDFEAVRTTGLYQELVAQEKVVAAEILERDIPEGESGRDRLRGRTAACSRERSLTIWWLSPRWRGVISLRAPNLLTLAIIERRQVGSFVPHISARGSDGV